MHQSPSQFGLGFRPHHYSHVTTHLPESVDWFEVISENFMRVGGRPKRYLSEVREHYPVALHGVSLSIGSAGPVDPEYLASLKKLILWLKPERVTDHLSWSSHGGEQSHDLLPLPYDLETLRHLSEKVDQVQNFLGQKLYLENPSAYLSYCHSVGEAQFLNELTQATGCGVLLDLNNLAVAEKNLGQDPFDYIETLRTESVGQFHLAGHRDFPGVAIDTHDQPVPDRVWEIYQKAIDKWPEVPAMIEWDDQIPEFDVLVSELEKARKIYRDHMVTPFDPIHPLPLAWEGGSRAESLEMKQYELWKILKSPDGGIADLPPGVFSQGHPVSLESGLNVYNQAYFLRIHDVLVENHPALVYALGEGGFTTMVRDYLLGTLQRSYSLNEIGYQLPQFLGKWNPPNSFELPSRVLVDLASLEVALACLYLMECSVAPVAPICFSELGAEDWEVLGLEFTKNFVIIESSSKAGDVINALKCGEESAPPELSNQVYLVFRRDLDVDFVPISRGELLALEAFRKGLAFGEIAAQSDLEFSIEEMVRFIASWAEKGLIAGINLH